MSNHLTMTDVAVNCLLKRKRELEFKKLRTEVAKTMKIPEEKMLQKKSQFYSELMLDNRFASLENNKWDLRNRRKFEEVHIDTSDIEIEEDEDDMIDPVDDSGLDIPSGEDAY
ncbi:MAG: DNA-directed RNA polymerase subunit delta [Solobacterium sp.]|nr:DNA-directed RNA polymerase subunit delta [Solobacterium sp.]